MVVLLDEKSIGRREAGHGGAVWEASDSGNCQPFIERATFHSICSEFKKVICYSRVCKDSDWTSNGE